jgi:hypothetical protein
MVSLSGAQQCPPLVAAILTLDAAVAALAAVIAANDTIGQITLQVYAPGGQTSSTVVITYPLSLADSQAIFNDIKNILSNDVNIETNALGAIT